MRTILLAVLLALGLAACGDSGTGPDTSFAGTYELQTVNGSPLPVVLFEFEGDTLELVDGSMTLTANGTWSSEHTLRATEAGVVTTETSTFSGTFTKSGSSVQFTDTEGDTISGTLSGSTLTLSDDDVVAVYQK